VTPIALADLASRIGVRLDGGTRAEVTGITHDSAAARPGDVYAAMPGAKRHGAEFAGDAVRAGAVAVLTDEAGASIAQAAGVGVPLLGGRGCPGRARTRGLGRLRRSDRPAAGHRHHRHRGQDVHLVPHQFRAARRRAHHLPHRHRGDPPGRRGGGQRPHHPEATDLQALFAAGWSAASPPR
jgi:hypothetical protein